MDRVSKCLHSQKIGPYMTQFQFRPKRRVGHFDVSLFLKNNKGMISDRPLMEGIYSKGNRSQNLQGWFDIHYSDRADFGDGNPVVLSQLDRCAEEAFGLIGKAIEPGGMIFVSLITDIVWEMKSELHEMTRKGLETRSLGIPPAVTPLGRLLFFSGCQNIKSQGFDVQGSSRLAGEKALNPDVNREFLQRMKIQLQEFTSRWNQKELTEDPKVFRLNAEDVLRRIGSGNSIIIF